MSDCDLLIVGAGPAGMSAAVAARERGISVTVLDDQAGPGGQIYRNIEDNARNGLAGMLGADYSRGIDLVHRFRGSGATYLPNSSVWQITKDGDVFFSCDGTSRKFTARFVLVATGSMERASVTAGWVLPGVLTVGAAQIMQKSTGALPGKGVWIAGCGPLAIYYAASLAATGHRIAGILDTTPPRNMWSALRHWRGGVLGADYLFKGAGLLARLALSATPRYSRVTEVSILGANRVERIRWKANGQWREEAADGVLLHEGVVPHTQLAIATGCKHEWDEAQAAFRPLTSHDGQTSVERVLVAGDCRSIGGARAAALQGRLAGWDVAAKIGAPTDPAHMRELRATERQLRRELAVRPLLDALYKTRDDIRFPPDTQIVCRCEVVSAASVRNAVHEGCLTADGVKSALRCGMGPCQGRLCGTPVASLIARERRVATDVVGPYRIRPPVKPISLNDLAGLAKQSRAS